MTKGYHIFMGWGMVTATVLTAMFGLPKLAGASAALKEQARWENRAQAFQDIGEASEVEIRSRSQLAARLTAAHLDTTMSNPWMLDLAMTQDVSLSAREMVFSAKQNSRELQCLAEAVYYEARSETRTPAKKPLLRLLSTAPRANISHPTFAALSIKAQSAHRAASLVLPATALRQNCLTASIGNDHKMWRLI